MANEQNLKPIKNESHEEATKKGRKGGIASGKARREKKTMRETAKMLMGLDISTANDSLRKTLAKLGVVENETTYATAMMASMMKEALKGNVRAAEFIRDTIGESPANLIKLEQLQLDRQKFEFEIIKSEAEFQMEAEEHKEDEFLNALNAKAESLWDDDSNE